MMDIVFVWDEARAARIAVLALDNGGALNTVVVASGLVDGAGLICDVGGVHVLKSGNGFSSVAAIIIHAARDHTLGRDVDIRPDSLSVHLYSICER